MLRIAEAAADRAFGFLATARPPAGPAGWSAKGARDFVTHVDRTAEMLIREMLLAAEPSGRVLGEELSPDEPDVRRGLVWVVDPLDGTTNFLHGYPQYAISIAAAVDGELLAGVVRHGARGDRYTAARGAGAFLDGTRLRVSTIDDPAFALIGTGFPFSDLSRWEAYQRQFRAVAGAAAGIRRAGAAALDLADVSAGRFEGFWELRLSPWDIAAGIVLIREAGGVITDFDGTPLSGLERCGVVAGNPAMHAWLLRTLAG
ncbi:MAG: inositol monophosphatase family protein [Gemmatimonadales bacterium]|nr:inositol monophosphatase family protein [Gemmatimonadales bacterium]